MSRKSLGCLPPYLMEVYPGVYEYEPTILHVAAIVLLAMVATYPVSLLLIIAGKIRRRRYHNGTVEGVFDRANRIVKAQVMVAFLAWVFAAAGTIVVALLAGLFFVMLFKLGIIDVWEGDVMTAIIAIGLPIHVSAQGFAYYKSVLVTQP